MWIDYLFIVVNRAHNKSTGLLMNRKSWWAVGLMSVLSGECKNLQSIKFKHLLRSALEEFLKSTAGQDQQQYSVDEETNKLQASKLWHGTLKGTGREAHWAIGSLGRHQENGIWLVSDRQESKWQNTGSPLSMALTELFCTIQYKSYDPDQ